MTARTARLLLALGAFVAGLVLFSAVIFIVTGRSPAPIAMPSAVGGPFKLVDQNAKPITDQDFKGQPFLVFFGFTHCPDVCPTTLFEVSEIFRALGPDAKNVRALFITVDPERDTPKLIKDYVGNFGENFYGLSGTPEQIAAAARAFRVYYQKVPSKDGAPYLMDHSSIVYVLDRNGRFVTHFTHETKAESIAATLGRLM
jgi:protein SCO1/2